MILTEDLVRLPILQQRITCNNKKPYLVHETDDELRSYHVWRGRAVIGKGFRLICAQSYIFEKEGTAALKPP